MLEGDGRVGEFVGGYTDWLRQRNTTSRVGEELAKPTGRRSFDSGDRANVAQITAPAPTKRKLNFKDARELEQLPGRIEQLETQIAARTQSMQNPDFYKRDAAAITSANAELAALQADLDTAYARWQSLDA